MGKLRPLLASLLAIVATPLLGAADDPGCPPVPPPGASWKRQVTEADRNRLQRWRNAWTEALAEAKRQDPGAVAAAGVLFDPDAALAGPMLPPGGYTCRLVQFETKRADRRPIQARPALPCEMRPGSPGALTVTAGAQRPGGRLYSDDGSRLVFLGTMQLSDEKRRLRYGLDRQRDLAGVLERVGDRRWRLSLPYPAWQSTLDVIEITPAGTAD